MVDHVHWAGQSGANFKFEVLEVGNEPADVPGIYIFAQAIAGGYYAKYIGQTGGFSARIPSHEQIPKAAQLGANQVHLMAVEGDETFRKQIESDLIARWGPPLNVQS